MVCAEVKSAWAHSCNNKVFANKYWMLLCIKDCFTQFAFNLLNNPMGLILLLFSFNRAGIEEQVIYLAQVATATVGGARTLIGAAWVQRPPSQPLSCTSLLYIYNNIYIYIWRTLFNIAQIHLKIHRAIVYEVNLKMHILHDSIGANRKILVSCILSGNLGWQNFFGKQYVGCNVYSVRKQLKNNCY